MFHSYSIDKDKMEIELSAEKYTFVEALIEELLSNKYTTIWRNKHNTYVEYNYEPNNLTNFNKIITIWFHTDNDKTKGEFLAYLLDKYKDFIQKCEISLYPI